MSGVRAMMMTLNSGKEGYDLYKGSQRDGLEPTCLRSDFVVSKEDRPTYELAFCDQDSESVIVEEKLVKKHGRRWVLKEIDADGRYVFSPSLGESSFTFKTKTPEKCFRMW